LPPGPDKIARFLDRFVQVYHPSKLSKVAQVLAVAAAHHRLLWIHPFYDGNGRVARLFVHAYLRDIGVGSSLWSVSRGLARNIAQYKALLMAADRQRDNDWDGHYRVSISPRSIGVGSVGKSRGAGFGYAEGSSANWVAFAVSGAGFPRIISTGLESTRILAVPPIRHDPKKLLGYRIRGHRET
jgi:hypothetical protein